MTTEKIDKIDDLEAEIRDDGRALLVYVVLTLMWGFVGLWILVSGEWHGFVFGIFAAVMTFICAFGVTVFDTRIRRAREDIERLEMEIISEPASIDYEED